MSTENPAETNKNRKKGVDSESNVELLNNSLHQKKGNKEQRTDGIDRKGLARW